MNIYPFYLFAFLSVYRSYYVYAYLREDGTPYYIGKGKDGRAFKKHGKVPIPKDKNRIVFLAETLMEEEAFFLEMFLIMLYGRKNIDDNGILLNITQGGLGGSGPFLTEEHKKNISKGVKGKKKPPRTDEHRENLRRALSGKKTQPCPLETRTKISEAQIGKKKPKVSLAQIGKKKGHWWTDGKNNTLSFDRPGEGFVRGRTM